MTAEKQCSEKSQTQKSIYGIVCYLLYKKEGKKRNIVKIKKKKKKNHNEFGYLQALWYVGMKLKGYKKQDPRVSLIEFFDFKCSVLTGSGVRGSLSTKIIKSSYEL